MELYMVHNIYIKHLFFGYIWEMEQVVGRFKLLYNRTSERLQEFSRSIL